MYPLLETIRWADGRLHNLSYHNARLNRSRQRLWGSTDEWDLAQRIVLPPNLPLSVHKCRVLYGEQAVQVWFEPYEIKPLRSLQLVQADHLHYEYKYTDRTELTALKNLSQADDILMVREGYLTDASYANVALWDGSAWYTPERPLLEGTRRAELLELGVLQKARIKAKEVFDFQKIRIFNAMIPWEESPEIGIQYVRLLG